MMKNSKTSLVFVYNADSGFFDQVEDFFHKIIATGTYQCNLCAVTYDATGMKNEWKEFIDGLTVPVEFLHRDQFSEKYEIKETKFPAAFVKQGEEIKLLISQEEINACRSLYDLMNLVTKKVEGFIKNQAEEKSKK